MEYATFHLSVNLERILEYISMYYGTDLFLSKLKRKRYISSE